MRESERVPVFLFRKTSDSHLHSCVIGVYYKHQKERERNPEMRAFHCSRNSRSACRIIKGSEKINRKRAALLGFWEKLLWVCIPAVMAAAATLVSNPELGSQFAIYSAAAVIALFGVMLSNRRAEKKKADEENELFKSALRALLRSELMRTHHQAVRDGHASTLDKEVMERTYQSYHRLGGNGIATNFYDEMMALPTRDE